MEPPLADVDRIFIIISDGNESGRWDNCLERTDSLCLAGDVKTMAINPTARWRRVVLFYGEQEARELSRGSSRGATQ